MVGCEYCCKLWGGSLLLVLILLGLVYLFTWGVRNPALRIELREDLCVGQGCIKFITRVSAVIHHELF